MRRRKARFPIGWIIILIGIILALFPRKSPPPRPYPLLTETEVVRTLKSLGTGIWVWKASTSICGVKSCTCCKRYPPRINEWRDGQLAHFEAMAKKAKKYKIGHVLLKAHDGSTLFRDYNDGMGKTFVRYRIRVLIWGYNRAIDRQREAERIISLLHKPFVTGYMFNTEAHVKGKPQACRDMLKMVRQHQMWCKPCSRKILGYSPYPFVSRHRSLPYEVFGEYCDFSAPQMYWKTIYGKAEKQPVRKVVNRTFQEWSQWENELNRLDREEGIKPIVPIGQAYHPGSARVTPAEVREFINRTAGYHTIQFYAWHRIDPNLWKVIGRADAIRQKAKKAAHSPRGSRP